MDGLKNFFRRKFSFFFKYIPDKNHFYSSKSYIKNFIGEKPIIVEAGAHIGLDTIKMSKYWNDGSINAFEPIPDVYSRLKKRTENLKNVKTFPLALGASNGFTKIFVSEGASDGSSSILPPKEHLITHPKVEFKKEIIVETITLDDWALNNKITLIDFLWLDLQGYELQVLKAGQKILKTVKAIYTEVNMVETYEGGALYPELKQWLLDQGFVVEVEELWWKEAGNVFFVRK